MSKTLLAPLDRWERMWAPYDEDTYAFVLAQIEPEDVVLDIGAGDLRLARQLTARARQVYALELNSSLINQADDLPANCQVLHGDARVMSFPEGITTAVLLMRHCAHFAHYYDKLRAGTCRRLITNARWGMGVETLHLHCPRIAYQELDMGWYACRCGKTGFKPGSPELLTDAVFDLICELDSCPACSHQ
jgi:hypothetical protein